MSCFRFWLLAGGLSAISSIQGATLYWDAGTNVVWGTASNWSTDLAGTTASGAAAGGADTAVFTSTPRDGTALVTFVNANTSVTGLVFNNTSTTTLYTTGSGITLSIGSGGVTMNSGAGTTTVAAANSTLLIKLVASQTWTNNSSGSSLFGQGTYDYNGGGAPAPGRWAARAIPASPPRWAIPAARWAFSRPGPAPSLSMGVVPTLTPAARL